MRLRVVVPILLALAAAAGLVLGTVLPGRLAGVAATGTANTASASSDGAGQDGGAQSDGASRSPAAAAFATTGKGGGVAAENQPQPPFQVTPLAAGERPPQFVVVSFDGACKSSLFQHWLDVGAQNDARFTFFLSGLCILPEGKRNLYHGPGKPVGYSAIGFADSANIAGRITDFTAAYDAGHEIGTHFLGHFCDAKGVGTWTTAQWKSEITQFNTFLDDWAAISGTKNPTPLPFNASVIRGGRTPCLLGKPSQMYPAFASFGYTYDASRPGVLQWPQRNKYGLWEFPLQLIRIAGYGRSALSMDYNLLANQNNAKTTASQATCDKIERSTYETYMNALKAVYDGNRAPLNIGNHFNTWVCGAYTNALTRFIQDASAKYPDVRFVPFIDVEHWLEAQDPATLKRLQALPTQRY